MRVEETALPGVLRVFVDAHRDDRGFFMETWNRRSFADVGIDADFVQDNFSRSARHTLRGLHYQIEQAQGKLVRVIDGEAFDVAVDVRRSSPTFGQWVGETLSADNHEALWIPPGFAHGFLALSDTVAFEYKCTDFYAPEHERVIRWDDPDIGIRWPLPQGGAPILSSRDAAAVSLRDAQTYP
jgi:dTDP-4-dehydrorhamnose 3,5-epimerase